MSIAQLDDPDGSVASDDWFPAVDTDMHVESHAEVEPEISPGFGVPQARHVVAPPQFIARAKFEGRREGYYFSRGIHG